MKYVFIVDDSVLVCQRLAEMFLDISDIQIIGTADDVEQAIKGIRELEPDFVILDIKLKTGNGIDVLKAIKKYSPSYKVIIFTNYPKEYYREKCMQEGAEYFLDKSTEFEKLIEILSRG